MTTEIRKLPEKTPRIETGVIQFGEDWPGVFIRGDNALYYAMSLRQVLDSLDPEHALAGVVLKGLADLLSSCDERRLMSDGVVYAGSRQAGEAVVMKIVDGEATVLPDGTDVHNHSPTGFEWGYSGSGPAQLALAILLDATEGDEDFSTRHHQEFKSQFIAGIQGNSFVLQKALIDGWIAGVRART